MSAASEDTQKTKKQCLVFEPQAWRKTLCRNCFKTKKEHAGPSPSEVDDQPKTPTSTTDDGDVVIIRREGTPMKDSSRSATPTGSSTPATTSPTAVSADKKDLKSESADKESDKATNKACVGGDKSGSTQSTSTASKVQTITKSNIVKAELQPTGDGSTTEVNRTKSEEEEKTPDVGAEQCADSKTESTQQSTTPALQQPVENNKADDAQGHAIASAAAPSSAAEPASVDEAVNSPGAVKPDSAAATPASAVTQSLPGYHDNASSPEVMLTQVGQAGVETSDNKCDRTTNARGNEGGSNESNASGRVDDAAAASLVEPKAATGSAEADSRSAKTSDEMASKAPCATADAKIDHGSGEAAAAPAVTVSKDAVAGPVPNVGEDSQRVRQLDLTSDQRVVVPGVQSGLFTNDYSVANSVVSASDTTTSALSTSSSIYPATAAESGVASSTQHQSHVGAATGNDFVPEVTSWDSVSAGHTKVEATITLSGSSTPYSVDSSRPIHVVSVSGISDFQRSGRTSPNVEELSGSRQPPDYEQSAGYALSAIGGDRTSATDNYGPTSPLVDYLSRSPFARSLQGATERSPETEIVATGGGGETSLFHHVPAAGDGDELTVTSEVGATELSGADSRDAYSSRAAANSDTENRYLML